MAKSAGGKGGRKAGRQKNRHPSQARYRGEGRLQKNKKRRAAGLVKRLAKAAAKGVHAVKVAARFAAYQKRKGAV